jgi:hypothetical protein
MGYFSYLYLIQADIIDEDKISITTEVFGAEPETNAYFSWLPGKRPGKIYSYGNDTIFTNYKLKRIEGYPINLMQKLGQEKGGYPTYTIGADFQVKEKDEATVLHILLPDLFVPRKDLSPLLQPKPPYAKILGDRIILTWPIAGPFEVKFCISPLSKSEELQTIDLSHMLVTEKAQKAKHGIEINFGIFKYKFER